MALQFLTEADFKGVLGATVLLGLKGTNSENLIDSESLAISELDPLQGKFDITNMLATSGTSRHKVLVRILVNITAYYLYNTVPDDEIPQRIVDNWKKELQLIKDLAAGKASSTLVVLTDDDTGEAVLTFRWGSNKKRTHDLYE